MFGTKKSREIFSFSDGVKQRHADPILVFRKIATHPKFNLQRHVASIVDPESPDSSESTEIAVEATREIFGLKAWSEDEPEGLTELETLDVLAQFINYMEDLKKNGSGQPT